MGVMDDGRAMLAGGRPGLRMGIGSTEPITVKGAAKH
eukprot:CAMPEP_0185613686 /NCGR_PEP_ID=MMETSP0436-20130131/28182_1 /TAXON_ID=626734 ORGANISM="Favella taraikaensis, Strain Fe Narragansett Bay" /NCGR_SAMPLE_ID=MMETSP0436 /ASSEMBLY_ACC=CAM_ASM_000390 /LENGTH=36 /DNA_ID= /DNA_START= /DNA_END= /DNA_ORIENTATION=